MKMKSFLAMALIISAFSVMAVETPAPALVIPQAVLDLHTKMCPEYKTADGEYLQKVAFKLPGTEYAAEGSTLYILGCEMYAYNSLEKAYIVNSYETKTVSIAEVLTDGSIVATNDLMGSGFDPSNNTLGTFQKGRGMGDCGSSATYIYNAYETRFVLIEARVKENCDGEVTEWPVVYKK
ncbi:MAG: DUF1176 domain-containing protein [Bacteriovorax sp.]|nr:DUF1176 domain-containing protein [Bacteriovorax sp.]